MAAVRTARRGLGFALGRAGKAVAVGRSYADHAKELGNPVPTDPVLFLKPSSSWILPSPDGGPAKVLIPGGTHSLHHEIEFAVLIQNTLSKPQSLAHVQTAIGGYMLALDMTDRLAQDKAKKAGLPWTIAKAIDTYLPLGPTIHKEKIPDHQNVSIWLRVNDQIKQQGNTKDMIFPINVLLAYIAHRITLYPGDIVLTGTPSGVGPVVVGDIMKCGIEGIPESEFEVHVEQGPIPVDVASLVSEFKK